MKSAHVLYAVDNEHQYLFPNNGYFACIIDFSRAIIDTTDYMRFTDHSIPSTFKLVADDDKFRSNEITAIINLYIQTFPNKIKQK